MHLRRKSLATALVTGLVFTGTQAVWAVPSGAAVPATPGSTAPAGGGITVTLLTGDRVTLASTTANATATVQPAEGRKWVRFAVSREGDSLYVIPSDAEPLLRSRKLDRRLFDVRELIRDGYQDSARDTLPLLVQYGNKVSARTADSTLSAVGATVTRALSSVDGAAVTARKTGTPQLWPALTTRSDFDRIWLDGKRKVATDPQLNPALDQSVPQIGAPAAWQAGYTGKGVTVAVLDTGVDTTHPDLAGKVSQSRSFTDEPDGDTVGHATHVASTIAGSGAASNGKYKGVAPDAELVSGKVCQVDGCPESAILAGMQWASAEVGAKVVNLSLGGGDGPEIDPLEEAVNTLTAEYGTLFVVAAGNDGPSNETVDSPGSADAALAVGAVDKSDGLADFSSRGPRVGDDAIKPDITAPGVDIVAARATGTSMGDPVDDYYTMASGTSMATPHVAGAAALLAQQHPDWNAGQLKAALMAAAKPNPALTAYQQGAGRVDVARAITQEVTTDPVSISFGKALWPHNDDTPIYKTVIYRNSGTTDVTLDLSISALGPDGKPTPAGLFTASAATLTVPAGSQAQVSVTADTRVPESGGLYSGQLVATGGTTEVLTPLGVDIEAESYNVTVSFIDANGAPATNASATLAWLGEDSTYYALYPDENGTVTVRVPKGLYDLSTFIYTDRGGNGPPPTSLQVRPNMAVTADTSITFDASRGKPVSTTVPESSAVPASISIGFDHYTPYGALNGALWAGPTFDGITTAYYGPSANDFYSLVYSQWAKPAADGRFTGSPYFYGIAEGFAGRLPTGYTKHVRQEELATVRQNFGAAPQGLSGQRIVFPVSDLDPNMLSGVAPLPIEMPGPRIDYLYAKGVRWTSTLRIGSSLADTPITLTQAPVRYQPGAQYQDAWNTGPFGPVLPAPDVPNPLDPGSEWISRTGDQINVDVPLYSDEAGHIGASRTDTSRTALYRDGELVGETGYSAYGAFQVPAEEAGYRLEVADTRSVSDLATQINVVWTFRSGHVAGGDDVFAMLPVSVVRFMPQLDADNAAPAGQSFDIPVTVQRQSGAPSAGVTSLTVEISYDDGQTWNAAPLRRSGDNWVATVQHPNTGGFVSLRASMTDSGGATVTQTVVHAYRLR